MNRNLVRLLPIVLALVAIGYQFLSTEKFKNPETGRVARVGLSPRQEQALGLQSYQQVLQEAGRNVLGDGPTTRAVQRIAQRLAAAASERAQQQYNWQLSVLRSDQVNAFCLPGGQIVVYTGILAVAENAGGLAVVMGHEMAHATSRHGGQRLFQQKIAQTLQTGVAFSMSDMDYTQQRAVMAALGAATQYGAILPFSRDHESEADYIGLLYMARAGYDPREAPKFWERMAKRTGGGGQPPEFASTHPAHATRIQRLNDSMAEAVKIYEAAPQKVPLEEQRSGLGGER